MDCAALLQKLIVTPEPGGILQWDEVVENIWQRVVSPGVPEGDISHLAVITDKHNGAYTTAKRMTKLSTLLKQSGLDVLEQHRLPLRTNWLKYETDLSMWSQQEFTATPRTKMDQSNLKELNESWQEQIEDIKAGTSLTYNLTTFVAQKGS